MLFLQRIGSVRYQFLETDVDGNIRVKYSFNDDRGYSAQRLIWETQKDLSTQLAQGIPATNKQSDIATSHAVSANVMYA